jgi:hypothetical protein
MGSCSRSRMNSGGFLPVPFSVGCALVHPYAVLADQISDLPSTSGIPAQLMVRFRRGLRNDGEQAFEDDCLIVYAFRSYDPKHPAPWKKTGVDPGGICTSLHTRSGYTHDRALLKIDEICACEKFTTKLSRHPSCPIPSCVGVASSCFDGHVRQLPEYLHSYVRTADRTLVNSLRSSNPVQ